MKFHVYILYSKSLYRFYVGHTSNITYRLKEHNSGDSAYTSQGLPWNLIWLTTKDSMRLAEVLEFKIKNLSRTRKIKFMQKYNKGLSNSDILESIKL